MALYLVTGLIGSGKSTLIRALGGIEIPAPTNTERVIEASETCDLYVSACTDAEAQPFRPYVRQEYAILLPWQVKQAPAPVSLKPDDVMVKES